MCAVQVYGIDFFDLCTTMAHFFVVMRHFRKTAKKRIFQLLGGSKMKLKRLLSALLATIMVVSQLPVISFAADPIDVNGFAGVGTEKLIYFKYIKGVFYE